MLRKLLFLVCIVFMTSPVAQAAFVVNWGDSWDPGDGPGYDYIADWLVDQGYQTDSTAAQTFAQTGYIGYNASDDDAFYFHPGDYTAEIVLEIAGYRDLNTLGYYNETNGITQLFSGPEGSNQYGDVLTGPRAFTMDDPFGFYMYSNYDGGTYWATDRSIHALWQDGSEAVNSGGDAQVLIYELGPEEWLLAWEDLDATRSIQHTDNDYNDMFVLVKDAPTTPEPATMMTFASFLFGLAGIGVYNRRRG